jgi:hypothetical protein
MQRVDEVVGKLFRKGFNPQGVAYVLMLLSEEHAPDSMEAAAYRREAEELLRQ